MAGKESCTMQSEGAVQKAPPNQSKQAHEPKRKGKAPRISRKREGPKHKRISSSRRFPPLPPPAPPLPETLAAAAEILAAAGITAPLYAGAARGRRSAACHSRLQARGAALKVLSLSWLTAERSWAPGGRRRRKAAQGLRQGAALIPV